LIPEHVAEFDRQWREVMAAATESPDLTEVHRTLEAWRRVAVSQDRPFTGTGSTSGGVPEWMATGARTGDDPQIWKLDRDGNAQIYAQYDPITKTWKPAR
jgi:Family of unknown function (DUF6247)